MILFQYAGNLGVELEVLRQYLGIRKLSELSSNALS